MTLKEQLSEMNRPALNALARALKVENLRDYKIDELRNHLIDKFSGEEIIKILKKPLWKRLFRYHAHIYGIATLFALIFAFLFFYFSQKGDEVVHKRIDKVEKTLERYDPLKKDTIFKEKEKKIEELKEALKDERIGDSKERKEALKELGKENYNKARVLFEKSIKEKSAHLAEDYYHLGDIHYVNKKPEYKKALLAYLEAERLDPGNTKYINSVGLVYHRLANYNKAIEYFEKALKIDIKRHGEEGSKVAIRWNNLGAAWHFLGNYQKAIDYYEKALSIDRKIYGDEHPAVARDWNNLGLAWYSLGSYQKAIAYYEKALSIDRKTYCDEHPNVAIRWNNLGSALKALGEYQKAIEYYKKALPVFEKMLGSEHPHTKIAKKNLTYAERKVKAHGISAEL